jgi:hypothetical protein
MPWRDGNKGRYAWRSADICAHCPSEQSRSLPQFAGLQHKHLLRVRTLHHIAAAVSLGKIGRHNKLMECRPINSRKPRAVFVATSLDAQQAPEQHWRKRSLVYFTCRLLAQVEQPPECRISSAVRSAAPISFSQAYASQRPVPFGSHLTSSESNLRQSNSSGATKIGHGTFENAKIPKLRPAPVLMVSVPPFAPTQPASIFNTWEDIRTRLAACQARILPEYGGAE